MKSLFKFVIEPKNGRYNNEKKIGDKNLLLNTELQNHQYVNRNGFVLSKPINEETDIEVGDEVIVHHNVFRRFYDVRGTEKNSSSYFTEDKYLCALDQVFLYKRNNKWYAPEGYCFVKPIKSNDIFDNEKEKPLIGVIKYLDKSLSNKNINYNDLVGFSPMSEYEFIIDGERLYRVHSNSITIKYEYQGNEEEYNPSWL
tara:strand:+ start:1254 stop:1850 length:597 start_codon:yes stop_codon:yes gene_type:complete